MERMVALNAVLPPLGDPPETGCRKQRLSICVQRIGQRMIPPHNRGPGYRRRAVKRFWPWCESSCGRPRSRRRNPLAMRIARRAPKNVSANRRGLLVRWSLQG
jgi:hypothetical protein